MKTMKKTLLLIILLLSDAINSQEALPDLTNLPEELRNEILNSQNQLPDNANVEITDTLKKTDTSQESEEIIEDIFGFSFFKYDPAIESPVLDIPLQSDYMISFDDKLELLLVGATSKTINLRVDLSGNVLIPDIGRVNLLNLSISNANKKISTIVAEKYIGTESFLSVKEASLKKISVIGAVNQPGTYITNPFISVSEAIKYAGGILANSSIRTIEIVDLEGNRSIYDLYDFLIFGDRSSDSNLKNGDTVIVKPTNNFFYIYENVQRPGKYEFKSTDTYSDLINFGLGVSDYMVETEKLNIRALKNNKMIVQTRSKTDSVGDDNIFSLSFSRKVFVVEEDVEVIGNGVTSGFYRIEKRTNLSNFIKLLNFSSEIYPFFGVVVNKENFGLKTSFHNFSIADPATQDKIFIDKNSKIYFFDKEDVLTLSKLITDLQTNVLETDIDIPDVDSSNINLSEQIDGQFKYIANFKETEFMKTNIFLRENLIDDEDIKLISIGKNLYYIPLTGIVNPQIIYEFIGSNSSYNKEKISILTSNGAVVDPLTSPDSENLISINFPALKNDRFYVEIEGQVNNPGRYLVNSLTTINDIYSLAGGLRENANDTAVFISRESVKSAESLAYQSSKRNIIDLVIDRSSNVQATEAPDLSFLLNLIDGFEPSGRVTGDFSLNSASAQGLYLEKDDYIFVPNYKATVTIFGEVMNPITVAIDQSLTISQYIDLAGGFSKYANKRDVYLIKANGTSVSLSTSFFQKEIFLDPGDSIVVPRNIGQLGLLPIISLSAKILSDMAFSAAALNSLQN